jgi:hypothetical protein
MRNKGMAILCMLLVGGLASAMSFGEWSPAISVESIPGTNNMFNTPALDGCPAPSRDGLALYMASNRSDGQGGLDIWVSRRDSADDAWGKPANLPPPLNTAADEFCPTPLRSGHGLLFVSTRDVPGRCGGADIYIAREHQGVWETPVNLGCRVNSNAGEASPSLVEYDDGRVELYFSSNRAGGAFPDVGGVPDSDIYVSELLTDGTFADASPVAGLNTDREDSRPNVRRDGLEIFFDSNRAGGYGGVDIWSTTRGDASAGWAPPFNAGSNVNSSANETRPFLTWGATTLYFGTNRAGVEVTNPPPAVIPTDIFVTTRVREQGSK